MRLDYARRLPRRPAVKDLRGTPAETRGNLCWAEDDEPLPFRPGEACDEEVCSTGEPSDLLNTQSTDDDDGPRRSPERRRAIAPQLNDAQGTGGLSRGDTAKLPD